MNLALKSVLRTPLCDLLGCDYPVVQTAMGWVADARLVAATCNAGGFGFLAGATIEPDRLEAEILKVKSLTAHRFGLNFHMWQPNAQQVIELVIQHSDRIRAVSYGRGPDTATIRRFKDAGVLCMPTVGAVKHAVKAIEMGADIVTVQGGEGGGHTGSVPTSILLPQVLDAVRVPVVVAVHGFVLGGGIGISGAADIVVASDCATFGVPEVDRGAMGGGVHLQRLFPVQKVRHMYFTGEMIDAQEAYRLGAVERIVPRAQLRDATFDIAGKIAAKSTAMIRLAKESLNGIEDGNLEDKYRWEQGFTFEAYMSADSAGTRKAFVEKRDASFKPE